MGSNEIVTMSYFTKNFIKNVELENAVRRSVASSRNI